MNKLIILSIIVLGVIAVAQLLRVNELILKQSKQEPGDIPQSENMFNANLIVVFGILLFIGTTYCMLRYGFVNLGPAASVSGQKIDFLFNIQYTIVMLVFFIFCGILFYFSRKYVRQPGKTAYYYPHNNKLEMVWTVVPSIVITVLVILGLKTWNDATGPADPESVDIEVYSYQFGWTARYSGADNKLGKHDYKLTTDTNPYGLVTRANIDRSLNIFKNGEVGNEGIKMIEDKLNDPEIVMSKKDRKELEKKLERLERMTRLLEAMSVTYADSLDDFANNDIIVPDSLVLLKGQSYNLSFRSKDVIHSAYMPHFRLQMNTVPGMLTYFPLQPIYSTKEMKQKMNDPDWEYALLCNKVCGGAHYKMVMAVTVLEPEEFLAWQKTKTTYDGSAWISPSEEAALLEEYKEIAASVN